MRRAVVLLAALVLPALAAGAGPTGKISTVVAVPHPRSLALLPDGGFLVVEPFANLVQRVGQDGTVTTVAGTGEAGFSGEAGPATQAQLNLPHGVALLPDGSFLIADTLNDRIRQVAPDGTITTVAGTDVHGFEGDDGPAVRARLRTPRGIASYPDGSYLVADSDNYRVRRVSRSGTIATVAGAGVAGFSGDGGPATEAKLGRPFGVATLRGGGFLIVDPENQRIRLVSSSGMIATVAGNGKAGFAGDGGPAIAASLSSPSNVAALPDGGFLIADTGNNRIRRVRPDGRIVTVAGTGTAGFAGDGGPAAAAMVDLPTTVAVRGDALGFLLGDSGNDRVRAVSLDLRPLLLRIGADKLRGRSRTPFRIAYTLSAPASVRLELRLRGTLVVTRRLTGRVGRNEALLGGLHAGSYVLRLLARAGDGRTATDSVPLTIT